MGTAVRRGADKTLRIRWLPEARRTRNLQIDFIGERNPTAAKRLEREITRQVRDLAAHPFMGRVGLVPDTRELVISRTPYIVVYRVAADRVVEILRIRHHAQDWPPRK